MAEGVGELGDMVQYVFYTPVPPCLASRVHLWSPLFLGLSLFSLCLAHSSEVLKALSLAGGFPGACHAPSRIPPTPGLCPSQTGPPGFWAVTV